MSWMKKISGAFTRSRPIAEILPEILKTDDPRTHIRPFYDDWLCPFTGTRVPAASWDGSPATLLRNPEITEYLYKLPILIEDGARAQLKAMPDLIKIIVFMRFERGDSYKVTAPSGEWTCPYCILNTGILLTNWDGSEAEKAWFMPEALKHLDACEQYKADPINGAKSRQEIIESGGDRAKLRKLLTTDPRFKVIDTVGEWMDPYAGRPVAIFNLKKQPWSPALEDKILDYLLGPECPGKYSQFAVEKTLEDLKTAAATRMKQF